MISVKEHPRGAAMHGEATHSGPDTIRDNFSVGLYPMAPILNLMRNSSHILVVDDHQEMRSLISQLLEKDGYGVSTAADGKEMHRLLGARHVDLIVLDLMLPDEDGLTLCRNLRAGSSSVPVIMLTAKGDGVDRILGLEMGADDYIAKPFTGRELVARIKAVLRRTHALPPRLERSSTPIYRFGQWLLDTGKRELESESDIVVPLSTGEYKLLLVFLQHPRRVLTRDLLLDLVKGRSAAPFDRSIDLQVSRLRRKIGDDARAPKIIKTVWGGGYIFTPKVSCE